MNNLLRRLCAALRPGGIVMVEDLDAFPVLATATGAYREAWLAVIQACRAAGLDMGWARDLPSRLRRPGLAGIGAEADVPLFRGGSDHARFWSLTWQQVRDRVIAAGERPASSTRALLTSATSSGGSAVPRW